MGLSLWAKNKTLDHAHGVSSWTMPASRYLALFLTDPGPGDASGNPTGTEASYTGYARQAVTYNAASGGVSTNSTTATFPSAGSVNGTANFVGYFDASSGGHLIESYAIAAQPINVGTVISVPAGSASTTIS